MPVKGQNRTFLLDAKRLPRHVAVIMDGNGRWARKRGLPRMEGHREGMNSVRSIIRKCGELGISYLTLYAFSTENWKRPGREVRFLMQLLIQYLKKELTELDRQGVRIAMLGSRERVPTEVLGSIDQALAQTKNNRGLKLNLAFNYGGRREVLDAVEVFLKKRPRPVLSESSFASCLYTAGLPDPDLLIRTSGEMRISNFLLWQLAYAEIVVSPVLWPDFRERELLRCLREFQKRERRFGGVKSVHA
ncbi:isoprenyl transferase [candidate division FCPU426 bacterium]|nr:isoprenyl transferase [candidate division FCPU426 bacterium]